MMLFLVAVMKQINCDISSATTKCNMVVLLEGIGFLNQILKYVFIQLFCHWQDVIQD